MRRRSFRPAVETLESILLLTAQPVESIFADGVPVDGLVDLTVAFGNPAPPPSGAGFGPEYFWVTIDWGDGDIDSTEYLIRNIGDTDYFHWSTPSFHHYDTSISSTYIITVEFNDIIRPSDYTGQTNVTIGSAPVPTPTIKYDGTAVGPFVDVIGDDATIDVVAPAGKTIDHVAWTSVPHAIAAPPTFSANTFDPSQGIGLVDFNPAAATGPHISFFWDPVGGNMPITGTAYYTDRSKAPFSSAVTVLVPKGNMAPYPNDVDGLGTAGFASFPKLVVSAPPALVLSSSDVVNKPGFQWSYQIDPETTSGHSQGGEYGGHPDF